MADDDVERFRPAPVPPRQRLSAAMAQDRRLRRTAGSVPGGSDGAWPSWLPWVAVVLLVAVAFVPRISRGSADESISYSALIARARTAGVVRATVDNTTGYITAELTDGRRVRSVGPIPITDADAQALSGASQLEYRTSHDPWWRDLGGFALLAAIMLSGWLLLGRRHGGQLDTMSAIGRSRARVWTTERPDTTFADVAGYAATKAEITEVVAFLTSPDRFRSMGARIPKGILLIGPPGTGKTLIARAVAGEAGVPFFTVTGSDFMELFVGVGAARVRDLFKQARQQAPCIVFIDEIDSIGRKRGAGMGGGHDEREQTLNQLLAEMDGFEGSNGIVVLAATNRPDILDQALLRPGRFDRQVTVPLPELDERHAILRVHTANKPLAADVDLLAIARSTPGMSGADLSNLVNESALSAVRRHGDSITAADVDNARDRVLLGQHRDSVVLTAAERSATAYHEAGHAVLAHVLEHADPLHKVSIIPRSAALGFTMQLPADDRHTMAVHHVLDQLAVAMGGRAAEQIVFGTLTTGAADDLVRSTELARRMVREWGMSERIGPMAWGHRGEVFLGEDLVQSKDCSDETLRIVDVEVERILRAQEQRAHDVLLAHRGGLDVVARALLDRETLTGAEVGRLLSATPRPGVTVKGTTGMRVVQPSVSDTGQG